MKPRGVGWLACAMTLACIYPNALTNENAPTLLDQYASLLVPHIGKTGGSSFMTVVDQHCEESRLSCQRCYPPLDLTIPYTCHPEAGARIVYGHGVFYGTHQHGMPGFEVNRTLYVTMMREPIDRLISYFWFGKRNFHKVGVQQGRETWVTMEEYFRGIARIHVLDAWMYTTQVPISGAHEPPTSDKMQKGLSVLRDNFFILLNEHWDMSLQLFATAIGGTNITLKEKMNANPTTSYSSKCMPPHVLPYAQEILIWEQALYDESCDMFDEQLARWGLPKTVPKALSYPICGSKEHLGEKATGRLPSLQIDQPDENQTVIDQLPEIRVSGMLYDGHPGLKICASHHQVTNRKEVIPASACINVTEVVEWTEFSLPVPTREGNFSVYMFIVYASGDAIQAADPFHFFGRFVNATQGEPAVSMLAVLLPNSTVESWAVHFTIISLFAPANISLCAIFELAPGFPFCRNGPASSTDAHTATILVTSSDFGKASVPAFRLPDASHSPSGGDVAYLRMMAVMSELRSGSLHTRSQSNIEKLYLPEGRKLVE